MEKERYLNLKDKEELEFLLFAVYKDHTIVKGITDTLDDVQLNKYVDELQLNKMEVKNGSK